MRRRDAAFMTLATGLGIALLLALIDRLDATVATDTAERDALARRVAELERDLRAKDVRLRSAERRAATSERRLVETTVPPVAAAAESAPAETAETSTTDATDATDEHRAETAPGSPDGTPNPLTLPLLRAQFLPDAASRVERSTQLSANLVLAAYVSTLGARDATREFAAARRLLSLSDGQERELRRAVAERDAAYRNAVRAIVEDDASGDAHVVERPYEPDLDRADEQFDASVRGILDDRQEAVWTKRALGQRFARPRPTSSPVNPVGSPSLRVGWLQSATAPDVPVAE